MGKLTGGLVNYYLAPVTHPQRKEQPAYVAECEDIAEALKLTPNEFCEFKAIWRTGAARLGNGKPDHKSLYDAEKRLHYAGRDVAKYRRELDQAEPVPEPVAEWTLDCSTFLRLLAGIASGELTMVLTAPGERPLDHSLPLETFHLGSSDAHFWEKAKVTVAGVTSDITHYRVSNKQEDKA